MDLKVSIYISDATFYTDEYMISPYGRHKLALQTSDIADVWRLFLIGNS